jgi:glycosyltransferase involved in cell wall biosynthesis
VDYFAGLQGIVAWKNAQSGGHTIDIPFLTLRHRFDVKKILLIAFHYPPFGGGSGIHRTLAFSRYLPAHGWQPIVLTAQPWAYRWRRGDRLQEIPPQVLVQRAFACDTIRHLYVRSTRLQWLVVPDQWASWWLGAVPVGLRLLRRYRPAIIWSTYPIATAHLIGLTLHRLTGVPWMADFRDSMTEDDYPTEPNRHRVCRWLERLTVQYCTRAVFTTPGAVQMYAERYPDIPPARWRRIANGYDEENFLTAEGAVGTRAAPNGRLVLVHSGALYPVERDPRPFFAALAALCRDGKLTTTELQIVLRASGYEDVYRWQLQQHGLADMVVLKASLAYREALAEMLQADGLLLFQASNCIHQIPAKVYEYLRARRPIFALTDLHGDTAGVLKTAGIDTVVPWDSSEQIAQGFLAFLARLRAGQAPLASEEEIARHSRRARTQELVQLLETIT